MGILGRNELVFMKITEIWFKCLFSKVYDNNFRVLFYFTIQKHLEKLSWVQLI